MRWRKVDDPDVIDARGGGGGGGGGGFGKGYESGDPGACDTFAAEAV